MNKILSSTLCFGLLTLLSVLIFLQSVHRQPYLTQDKKYTNREELLLSLQNKNFDLQRPFNTGKLRIKPKELVEVTESETSYAVDGLFSSHPSKRACFWKYCV
uniref:Urotensin 2B n=1 Tax=Aotus nancymaae TaxID=37293 RepID=A0A2K5EHH4_AOTNA